MKKATKLTKEERLELSILKQKDYSIRSIASVMNRSPSTISREIQRNKLQRSDVYDPHKATHKAYIRKKYTRFQWKKINHDRALRDYIVNGLKQGWNPDEIAGRMKQERQSFYVSKNSIYRWLYSTQGSTYCQYLYSGRYTRKKRRLKVKRRLIPNRVSITERSVGANHRSRYGHLEVDTVVSGKRGSGALLVSVDRKGRYVSIQKLKSLRPQETTTKLQALLGTQAVKSITFDNGIENRYHERLGLPTFFTDPYSSWQKGSVENANKMIRRYIPKGSDISKVPRGYIQYVERVINKKPRKVLGYKSAYEVMMKNGVLLVEECCD